MSSLSKSAQGQTSRQKLISIIWHCDMEGEPLPLHTEIARQLGISAARVFTILNDLIGEGVVYLPSKNCYRLRELDDA